MNQEQIDRINALYRKSKAEGLTEEEKKEQALLRREYLEAIRVNFKATLDSIEIIDKKINYVQNAINNIHLYDFYIHTSTGETFEKFEDFFKNLKE